MTKLKVYNMHKLLKKTIKYELSYCITILNMYNIHQLLKKIMNREAQLSKGYNII
jgi:hypothetical protein